MAEQPSVIVLVKNDIARARALCAFMETGGELGVMYRFRRFGEGGIFVADYPDEHRDTIIFSLLGWMQQKVQPYMLPHKDWILNGWRQPLTPEQMENFNTWRAKQDEGLQAYGD